MPISMKRHELWSMEHAVQLCGSEQAALAAADQFNRQIGGGCSWDIGTSEIHYGDGGDLGPTLAECDALRATVCTLVAA